MFPEKPKRDFQARERQRRRPHHGSRAFNDRTFRVPTSRREQRAREWLGNNARQTGSELRPQQHHGRGQHHWRDYSQARATRMKDVPDMMNLPLPERGILSARLAIARRILRKFFRPAKSEWLASMLTEPRRLHVRTGRTKILGSVTRRWRQVDSVPLAVQSKARSGFYQQVR